MMKCTQSARGPTTTILKNQKSRIHTTKNTNRSRTHNNNKLQEANQRKLATNAPTRTVNRDKAPSREDPPTLTTATKTQSKTISQAPTGTGTETHAVLSQEEDITTNIAISHRLDCHESVTLHFNVFPSTLRACHLD